MTFTISSGSGELSLRSQVANYLAPAAALTYPLTLSSFHASVSALPAERPPTPTNIAATLSLASSFDLLDQILVAIRIFVLRCPSSGMAVRVGGSALIQRLWSHFLPPLGDRVVPRNTIIA